MKREDIKIGHKYLFYRVILDDDEEKDPQLEKHVGETVTVKSVLSKSGPVCIEVEEFEDQLKPGELKEITEWDG